MPHQPVEDRRRPQRSPAGRAGRPAPALTPRPRLFVVTGPSGAGKGTLIQALVRRRDDLEVAVSATTRPRRPGEDDGREYYFLTEDEFLARVRENGFLEHVVYVGHRYGTLRSEVDRIFRNGRSCVLELETKGARAIKEERPESVTVFVSTPSFAELERRLRERATESSGDIGERLEVARQQMGEADDFDHVVVNDDVERAVGELENVVDSELAARPATSSGSDRL